MRVKYLGDSYDLVKRFWAERFRFAGTLLAHPTFVPAAIRERYTALTTIPVAESLTSSDKATPFGLLMDPDTGISFPVDPNRAVTVSHVPLPFLLSEWERLAPTYMVCFDQSFHRRHRLSPAGQRRCKMSWLRQRGIYCAYYVSHAPFLFMAKDVTVLGALRAATGIPRNRFRPRGPDHGPR